MRHRFYLAIGYILVFLMFAVLIQPQNALASGRGPLPRAITQATAISCSGQGCEGLDPFQTGCGSLTTGGAKMVNASSIFDNQTGIVLARFYNWYSNVCQTNWVQAEVLPDNPNAYPNVKIQIDIYRSNNDPVYCYPTDCVSFDTHEVNPMWSNMAYAPIVVAYAEVVVQSPNDHHYYSGTIGA